jgi:type VI secretion system secreted protein Hcp
MAVDMFIKIDNIKGESTDKTHDGDINVLSWSWGASNSSNAHIGGGSGTGKVNVQDLSFTKYVDSSSHNLIQHCFNGHHLNMAKLVVRKAGKTPLEYIKIQLDQVFVTSVSTGGSGGEDRLTENITLNFAKFKFEYTPQKADGSGGTALPVSIDIPKHAIT